MIHVWLLFRLSRAKEVIRWILDTMTKSDRVNIVLSRSSHWDINGMLTMNLLSVPEKGAYLVSRPFPRRRRIMVSLEYLPYYWKLFNHMWQLYTLGVGKFFHMLKFDLSSLSRSHDQKIIFSGTPARHSSSGKSTDRRGL